MRQRKFFCRYHNNTNKIVLTHSFACYFLSFKLSLQSLQNYYAMLRGILLNILKNIGRKCINKTDVLGDHKKRLINIHRQ